MKWILITLTIIAVKSQALECAKACDEQLTAALDGKALNESVLTQCHAYDPPSAMFTSGGSQNQALMCNAAISVKKQNDSWFHQYFDFQIANTYQDAEIFSEIYDSMNTTSVLVILNKTNDESLKIKARQWLRAQWVFFTLGGSPKEATKITLFTDGGAKPSPAPADFMDGLYRYVVSTRTPINETWETGNMLNLMFALALNTKPRKFTWGVDYHTGWGILAKLFGFSISPQFKVNFEQKDLTAAQLGLTEDERSLLREVIYSYPTPDLKKIDQISKWFGSFKPKCEITIERFDTGFQTYFGTPTTDGYNCSGNKPNKFAMTFKEDSKELVQMQPYHHCGTGCPRGKLWQDDNQFCATGHPDLTICIPKIKGTLLYKAIWAKEGLRMEYLKPICNFPEPCFCEANPLDPQCVVAPPNPPGDGGCKSNASSAIIFAVGLPYILSRRRKKNGPSIRS